MSNILVTAIGSFSADITIKALKASNHKVIGCDIYNKEWIVDAYNVDAFYQAPYSSNATEYIDFILNICLNEQIEYIIPLTDAEIDVLNAHRLVFQQHNIALCISDYSAIILCRNKYSLSQFINIINLSNDDILTIPSYYLETCTPNNIEFPVICKPISGRSSQGLKIIKSINEFLYVKEAIDNSSISDYIIQPLIEGNIITIDVINDSNNNSCYALARKELLRTGNGAGTSVYIYNQPILEDASCKIAKELNILGCVNFEFIETTDGKYYFLECNPRFSGGIEFSYIAGYDFINNHLRCFTKQPISQKPAIKNQYIARKYEEYVTKIE